MKGGMEMTTPLDILDRDISKLKESIERCEAQIAAATNEMESAAIELVALERVRKKIAAVKPETVPQGSSDESPPKNNGHVTSATKELRRMLAIQPMTTTDLADDIAGRLVGDADIKDKRKLVMSSMAQLLSNGHATKDNMGFNHLIEKK